MRCIGADRRRASPARRRSTISSDSSRRLARSGSWCLPARRPSRRVTALASRLSAGDVIIDGGNTHFKDDVRRARALAAKGLQYVDVGTSGGVWGAERGYCLMIGGDRRRVERLTPIFRTLAPGRGRVAADRRACASLATTAPEGFCTAARRAPATS